MAQKQLDGMTFYNAALIGARHVIKHKRWMNEINVFPVADGDTGSNLSNLMTTIIHHSQGFNNVSKTLRSIADASLIGARGNSGIIFAQFLNGLSSETKDISSLSTQEFAKIAKQAVGYAHDAVLEPVEGTILTIMAQWANACEQYSRSQECFVELFSTSLTKAKKALDETPDTLKVLSSHKVVDSGAFGFVSFLEGMLDYLKNKTPFKKDALEDIPNKQAGHTHTFDKDEPPKQRYCTEALVNTPTPSLKPIRQAVQNLGDSTIVAGRDDQCRLHIHTNQPAQVFAQLRTFGDITEQKVDDMLMQFNTIHHRKSKIALVVDSNADIPQHLIDKHQIHLIPLNVIIEGSSYLDKLSLTPETLYSMIDDLEEYPTTSQPSYQVIDTLYARLVEQFDSVIVLSLSKALSGTYQILANVAEKYQQQNHQISVIDTRSNSGTHGLLAIKAAELIEQDATHDAVVRAVEDNIERSEIFVCVENIKYMVNSGRLGKVAGFLAKASNLKPIISVDDEGKVSLVAKAFSQTALDSKLMQLIQQRHKDNTIEEYCIVHAKAPEKAQAAAAKIESAIGVSPSYIAPVSPAVGLHAGVGCLGISILKRRAG